VRPAADFPRHNPLARSRNTRKSWSGIAATKEKANRSGAERAEKT